MLLRKFVGALTRAFFGCGSWHSGVRAVEPQAETGAEFVDSVEISRFWCVQLV